MVPFAPDSLQLLGLSLDEMWSALPSPLEVKSALREWGIYDGALAQDQLNEWWVFFSEASFGVVPIEC